MDQQPSSNQRRRRDQQVEAASKHVVRWVIGVGLTLLILAALMAGVFVHSALQPTDVNAKAPIVVTVKSGETTDEIGAVLQQKGLIKSATVFKFYVKFHNVPSYEAGQYSFTKANTMQEMLDTLRGGSSTTGIGTVLVKEGEGAEDVAAAAAKLRKKDPKLSRANFMAALKDEAFFKRLQQAYPQLLGSAAKAKGVRYRLEGYLFPATYTVTENQSAEALIAQMVAKTNAVMTPYMATIQKQKLSVQEVLTLASLVEREGVTDTDRGKIAGVFFNRLDAGMPLQTDVAVMYALNTHKTHLSNKDTSVDSPYNLYRNKGYGPGPVNSPSESAIKAVLAPLQRSADYLYFVANLKTGEIRYARTLAEQNVNTAAFAADNGQGAK
ncbi:endolytic transglycosylase MltG [Lacticaseibacillus camelliae]|uniref:Endolytic murein transglycosylase n=1 Tax=Lacticaseibacillus camelliae DSM 22697 = JCM 13995 TaxID=1423730 RepID=A0A0R2F8Y6_9LACO|nr:endolytic transglycosylase MltG [Lacticaseibacillus camelliae]KRN24816.1 aminodeoxychorismate lyase [Lacticaseibacillus camelliae DSM 22697 = JCM 13995]